MGARAIETGGRGGPFAFVIPQEQHDPHAAARLEELLLQGGIEIHRALEPFGADGDPYPAGTDVILLSQPYRAYAKTLLERQRYPATRVWPGGPATAPYDVTAWTLPLQMGVDVRMIDRWFEAPAMSRVGAAAIPPAKVWGERTPGYYMLDARGNGGAIAANRLLAAGLKPAWTTAEMEVNGYRYALGSLVVSYSKAAPLLVEKIAAALGLRADGVKGKVPAAVRAIGGARVALYKSWVENSDEGWTRWILERYEFPFKNVNDADVRAGNLRAQFDAIVLPSASSEQLVDGHRPDAVPAEYAGGLGDPGIAALKAFVEAGGTLICLDRSAALAVETFNLPLRDAASGAGGDRLFGPGSIVRVDLDPSQPLAYGMTPQTAGFFLFSSAYEVVAPEPASDGRGASAQSALIQPIARYASKDVLLSGWLDGEEVIAGRPAVVLASVGAGRVVLIGFRAQHRAQSHATFRLLFNAIFTAR